MATFKNVTGDLRYVSHGLRAHQAIPAGEQVTVPDDVAGAYGCQPAIWAPVDSSAQAAAKTEAAKSDLATAQAETAAIARLEAERAETARLEALAAQSEAEIAAQQAANSKPANVPSTTPSEG